MQELFVIGLVAVAVGIIPETLSRLELFGNPSRLTHGYCLAERWLQKHDAKRHHLLAPMPLLSV
jgi:hypothetical protein